MNAGKEYNIAPATPSQINRIESGMLSYGSDMTLNENPFDIGLEKLVDLNKQANFLSKETLNKVNQLGAKKELIGIEIISEPFNEFVADHLILKFNDQEIGKITSSVYSPRLKKNIGLALIDRRSENINEGYTVNINGSSAKVKICNLPFLRNK